MAKSRNEDVSLDMTPMIDVVFQLIIFFVVTLKMSDDKDTTIKLADGKNGIVLTQEELPPSQLTIDVAQSGRVSMSNITMSDAMIVRGGRHVEGLLRGHPGTQGEQVARSPPWLESNTTTRRRR